MKASKLWALLAFAGLCGTMETQARSHKYEIKHLEKQRAERLEEHGEARERLNELNSQMNFGVALQPEGRLEVATFVTADAAEAPEAIEDDIESAGEEWTGAPKIPNVNWQAKDSELIRERELEQARMREAAREIARIDKAIRKQKAHERRP